MMASHPAYVPCDLCAGRALSFKLIKQLRSQAASATTASGAAVSAGGRVFRDIQLEEPIRYSAGDHVESWLNELLCLDSSKHGTRMTMGCPHPSKCELYFVERDTLFSYHRASEAFLQKMMALYVSSHYKNTPDDLLLLADAPAHQLFVLLGALRSSHARATDNDHKDDAAPHCAAILAHTVETTLPGRTRPNQADS